MSTAAKSKDLAKLAHMGIATVSGDLAADMRNAKIAAKVRTWQDAASAAYKQISVAEAIEMHPDLFKNRVTKSGREVLTFYDGTHRKDFDVRTLDVERIWVDWLPASPKEPEEGDHGMTVRPDKFVYSTYEKYLTPSGSVRAHSNPEDDNDDEFDTVEGAISAARAAMADYGDPTPNYDPRDPATLRSITYLTAEVWRETWFEPDEDYVVDSSQPEIVIDNLSAADKELAHEWHLRY